MEYSEFETLKKNDDYLIKRRKPTPQEEQLFLKEVDFACPLCGKDLRNHKQLKKNKLYEIAHIYPNSPTIDQYITLRGVEKLGKNSEAFENKIALCKDCHDNQDYHTSKADYEKLLNIKKDCLIKTRLLEATFQTDLEKDIADIIEHITNIDEEIEAELNDLPVYVKNKFHPHERILKARVTSFITQYYPYVRDLFRNLNGKNDFNFRALCLRIKSCYVKLAGITDNKEYIFNAMVDMLIKKTGSKSTTACEIIISFFIQNCEVFDEITE